MDILFYISIPLSLSFDPLYIILPEGDSHKLVIKDGLSYYFMFHVALCIIKRTHKI